MNRLAQHRLGARRREADATLERRVPCSLSPTGFHKVSVTVDSDFALVSIHSECNARMLGDAVERMGGDLCLRVANDIRKVCTEGGDLPDDSPAQACALLRKLCDETGTRSADMQYQRGRARKNGKELSRYVRAARTMTRKARGATDLELSVFWRAPTDVTPGQWRICYKGTQLATREWGAYGWAFDDETIEQDLTTSVELYAIDSSGIRDLNTEGKNRYCMVCRKSFSQKHGHLKTGRHRDNVRAHLRLVMRMFPGAKQ